MPPRHRPASNVAALLSLLTAGAPAAADPPPAFDPAATLFFTFSDDPTSTATAAWLEAGPVPDPAPGTADRRGIALPVPRVGGVTVDGDADDWGPRGVRVNHLQGAGGAWPDPTGHDASVRIGWDDNGLLVLAEVTDDQATEAAAGELWSADSVEVMLYPADGSADGVQVLAGPGLDPQHPAPRFDLLRPPGQSDPAAAAARVRLGVQATESGYRVELRVPWPTPPSAGTHYGVQVLVNDKDGAADKRQLAVFPSTRSHEAPIATLPVVLTGKAPAAEPDALRATARVRRATADDTADHGIAAHTVVLDVGGEPSLIGASVRVRSGTADLGTHRLDRVMGYAGKLIPLPTDRLGGGRVDAVTLERDGQTLARVPVAPGHWAGTPARRRVTLIREPAGVDPDADPNDAADDTTHSAVSRTTAFHADQPQGVYAHHVTFRGLAPDTLYRVSVDGFDDPVGLRTAPAALERPLTFAEGGDVGTGGAVPRLHRQAAAWDPFMGVVGGDLAYANGTHVGAWVDYLREWNADMRVPAAGSGGHGSAAPDAPAPDRLVPMVVCIGNHETRHGFDDPRSEAPLFYNLFQDLFAQRNYATLDFGRYLSLLLLDSGHTSDPAGAQTDWLAARLAERRDVPHLFAVYHVPMYPSHRGFTGGSRGPARAAMREHWLPLLQRHQVPLAFEHDDHTYKRTPPLLDGRPVPEGTPGSIVYVGDGAWGRGDRAADTRDYLAVSEPQRHVIKVTLHPNGHRELRVVDPDGEPVDAFTVNAAR